MSSVLIYQPKDCVLPLELLKRCFDDYNDSVGFSYIETLGKKKLNQVKQVKTNKNFKSFDNFYSFYEKIKDSPKLIHFAQKLDGLKNYCGPFNIDNNHVLIHSGNIWNKDILEIKDESQSANLLRVIKRLWNPVLFGDENIGWLIEEALNSNNMAAIMNNLGDVQIFNKKQGFDLHGCWLSRIPHQKQTFSGGQRYNYPSVVNKNDNNDDDDVNVFGKKPIFCGKCGGRYFYSTLVKVGEVEICTKCHSQQIRENLDKKDKKEHPNSYLCPAIADPNFLDVFDLI